MSPPEFLSNALDNHRRERTLARMDAIDWWVTQAPLPSIEQQNLIDVLYSFPRKEVKDYMSINWKDTRVRFGWVLMNKEVVSTRAPAIKIPRHLQESMILQAFLPDFTLKYEATCPDLEANLKAIIDSNLSTKMSFMQQVRIIMQHLDSRPRLQPMTVGTSDSTGIFRYTISQANLSLRGIKIPNQSSGVEAIQNLVLVAHACQLALDDGADVDSVKDSVVSTKKNGVFVTTLLDDWEDRQSIALHFLLAITGRRTSMGSRIREVQFYPVPSEMPLIIRESRNKSGFKMNMYVCRETIGFKYKDVLGQFVKDSGLANLVIKIADFTDMTHVIACIAVYCRWNFSMTKSVNRVTLEEEIYHNAKTDVRHFLSMNKNTSASCLLIEGTYGKVVTTEHCEIGTANRSFCQIVDATTIRNILTNQTTQLPMPPNNLQIPNGPLKRYDTPSRRLYYVISHYLRHIDETISRIRNKDFGYLNKSIMSLV